jgi:ribose transport system substrate-binding protein
MFRDRRRQGVTMKLRTIVSAALFSLSLGSALSAAATAVDVNQIDAQRASFLKALNGKKIVFLSISQGNELGQYWYYYLKKELEPLGVKIDLRDFRYDTTAGAQAFTQVINEDYDLIIAWNSDRNAFARLIQQAQRKGTFVVSINMGSIYPADAYVGADWVTMAQLQMRSTIEACKGKSEKVAVIQGTNGSAANQLAEPAIDAVLAEHPEVKLVSKQNADWDINKAKNITATILKQNPDLCGVVGYWNGSDLGIAAAVDEAGLKGKVYVSTNGSGMDEGACAQIRNGTFDQYVSYDVPTIAVQLNTEIKSLLTSGAKPGALKALSFVPNKVITAANVDQPGMCWSMPK